MQIVSLPARSGDPSQVGQSRCVLSDRYYRALSSIETRFPISKDAGHVHVSFTWFDAFRPSKRAEQVTAHCSTNHHNSGAPPPLLRSTFRPHVALLTAASMFQASIHFEKAAILFNIAAIASQLAVATDRTSDAGVKEAARLFQVTLPPDVEVKRATGAVCLVTLTGGLVDQRYRFYRCTNHYSQRLNSSQRTTCRARGGSAGFCKPSAAPQLLPRLLCRRRRAPLRSCATRPA